MPTYQLICNECGKDFEFFLTRIIRDEDKVCPNCTSKNVKQVYKDFIGYRASSSGKSLDQGSGGCGSPGGFK